MRILYGRCFGLGNAVMCIPTLKALWARGHFVDVLVGTGPDDFGALDVMLEFEGRGYINKIHVNHALGIKYDVAIMAIPFDGRWTNGTHFHADRVIDCRPRPGDPTALGLESWKKHEVEYQLDNVNAVENLGPWPVLPGEVSEPSSSFMTWNNDVLPETRYDVYLGVGFKRDRDNFWSRKHWGNDRFARFINCVKRLRPGTTFLVTGGQVDFPVMAEVNRLVKFDRFIPCDIRTAFREAATCRSYFGNDTGMAHVMASYDRPTYMMTAFPGSEIKNPPRCSRSRCNQFHTDAIEPESVAEDFIGFVWGGSDGVKV